MTARVDSPAALAALLRVDDADALTRQLCAMEDGESPFAKFDTVHFARLQLIGRLTSRRPRRRAKDALSYLFFAAEVDSTVDGFLEALPVVAPELLETVFAFCTGYPGRSRPTLLADWILEHDIAAGFSVHGHPCATVGEICTALELRNHLVAFALQTRDHDATAFAEAWRARRWGG